MKLKMKYKLAVCCSLILVLFSCKNEDQKRIAENRKEVQKKEVILSNIQKGWIFYDTPVTEASENSLSSWNEWRIFLAELAQKPKKTITAFQQKSKSLTKKVMALTVQIPVQYDKPQIRSRIGALITKVQMLDLYIHLDNIPDKKVTQLVAEINLELVSLQRQMDKIVEKSKIPIEEGESDMLKMMDTARAIPNTPKIDPNIPRVE